MGLAMFDYDGVIVDSFDQVAADFMKACHANGFLEIKTKEDLAMLHQGNCYEEMMRLGLDEKTVDKIISDYEKITMESQYYPEVFEGMPEALQKIAKKHTIVVITSNISAYTKKVLMLHGIDCVAGVIGAEVEKSKVLKIRKTMELYPLTPVYYIGDTVGDILEGKAAGILTVGVAWGWQGSVELQKAAPDYLVYTPRELVDLLCGDSEF
jgi:phosphoglycolate phosphatase